MLLVGVDWAEAQHAVCLLRPEGGRPGGAGATGSATVAPVRRLTIPHSAAGLRRLGDAIAAVEGNPSEVLVAVERPDGLLVEWLLAAGYVVYALPPKAVQRYRERTRLAGAKSDPADAELLARILLTDRDRHQPLRPSSARVEEIRALARQDERAGRDERRLHNRLRQDLLDVFPAALAAFPSLGTASALCFLAEWPEAEAARRLGLAELERFLRAHSHGQPARAAARIHAALRAEALAAPAHLARARAGGIRLAVQQLLLLRRQRAAWERRLRELLAGAGGAETGGGHPEGDEEEEAHPDGEILLSLPGLDARLAARVLGEVGDRRVLRGRFPTPAALQCYAGTAPVTKASGRHRVVVTRWACNRFLRQALLRWAFCSVPRSAWARAYYDAQRAAGKTHFRALRGLANRWVEVLHHLLAAGCRYDEAVHQRNLRHCTTSAPAQPAAA